MRKSTLAVIVVAVAIGGLLLMGYGCSRQAADGPTVAPPPAPQASAAEEVMVFVPCGILGPFEDVKTMLRRTHPSLQVKDKAANTVVLTNMILDGKEACDVYLALGNTEVEQLTQAGKVARAVPVAGNGLGLIVQKGNPLGIRSIADLASDKVKAIAVPTSISSVGAAGEEALRNAGIWDKVERKLVRPDSPDATKTYVSSRKADAALIYSSCLTEIHQPGQERLEAGQGASQKVEDIGLIDQALYTPFFVNAVVTATASSTAAVDALIEALLSPDGQSTFGEWSFVPLAQTTASTGD